MKTRAVLLGTGGWPFIIKYWLENLKTWEDKIDKVYLAVDKYSHPDFSKYLHSQVDGNPKITLMENCNPWPNSYTDAFKASKEDLFLICHDDTYITTPLFLDIYFNLAEEGKVITPIHEIYSPKETVENWLKSKYPNVFPLKVFPKIGDPGGWEGYSFLLYLIFISRENMEKTTLDFNGWASPTHAIDNMGADTGFKFMLDLCDAKIPIYPVPRSIGYLHLQNTGNTYPEMVDRDDVPSDWDKKAMLGKADMIEKMISVDDYKGIEWYKERALQRIKKIRSKL